jgi:hypothetical protein
MHESQESAPDTLAENSESKLIVSVPEVASGKDRLVSHWYNAPTENSTNERGNSETNSRGTEKQSNSAIKSGKPSYANKPHANTRRAEQSDSDSDGNKRRRIATKHEDAIACDTSDTDDYNTSSSDGSSNEEEPTKSSRSRRKTSKSHGRNSDSESEEGTWLDTASDSDDSSSDSDLDVRASQRKSYRRKRVGERNRRPTKQETVVLWRRMWPATSLTA